MNNITCGHIQHMYFWWWVRLSPETCRVKPLRRMKQNCCVLLDLFHNYKAWCTEPQILNTIILRTFYFIVLMLLINVSLRHLAARAIKYILISIYTWIFKTLWPTNIPIKSMLIWKTNLLRFHGCTLRQQYQIIYCPNNALNYTNCRVIKNTLKI